MFFDNSYDIVSEHNQRLRNVNIEENTAEMKYGSEWYNANIQYIGMS
jgi:hypothetical protein